MDLLVAFIFLSFALLIGLVLFTILYLKESVNNSNKLLITELNKKEIEIFDFMKEYFDQRVEHIENKLQWNDFNPNEYKGTYHPTDKKPEPKRDENGKFNPDEIEGALDGLFAGEK